MNATTTLPRPIRGLLALCHTALACAALAAAFVSTPSARASVATDHFDTGSGGTAWGNGGGSVTVGQWYVATTAVNGGGCVQGGINFDGSFNDSRTGTGVGGTACAGATLNTKDSTSITHGEVSIYDNTGITVVAGDKISVSLYYKTGGYPGSYSMPVSVSLVNGATSVSLGSFNVSSSDTVWTSRTTSEATIATAGTYHVQFVVASNKGSASQEGAVRIDSVEYNKSVTSGTTEVNSTVAASLSTLPADGTTTSTITVTLLDAAMTPLAGKNVTLASSRGASDTISPASGPSNGSGVVTFSVKSTTPGTAVFTATDSTDSITVNQTASVTFTAVGTTVSATNSTLVAAPGTVLANGSATATLTATLKDTNNNPVAGKTVTLAKTSGPGSPVVTTIAGTTNSSGIATFTVKSTTTGTAVFTATDTTDGIVLTQTAGVTFIAEGTSSISQANASGDVAGFSVNATDLVNQGQATLSSATRSHVPLHSTSGDFGGYDPNNTGTNVPYANDGAIGAFSTSPWGQNVEYFPSTQFAETATPVNELLPVTYIFTLNTTLNPAGYDISGLTSTCGYLWNSDWTANQVFQVEITKDGSTWLDLGTYTYKPYATNAGTDNKVSQVVLSNAGGGALNNGTDVAQHVTAIRINYSDPGNTSGFTGTAIKEIDVVGVPSVPLVVAAASSTVTASPTTIACDGVTTSTITVALKDAAGIPVAGKTVTLASSRGASDTISPASGISNGSGVVTFSVKSATAGPAVFTATDTTDSITVTQTASVTFSAIAVSAATSTVTASPATVTADGTSTSTVTVTLKNAGSTAVAGQTVTLASSRGASDTISPASGVSNASGVVTFTVKSTTMGASVLTASDTSDNLVVTQTAAVTFIAGAGSAANSTVTATPAEVMADGATTATVTVTLKDVTNNPVAGKTVTLASSRGASDTIAPSSGTSAANGVVTFSVKSTTPGSSDYTATDTTDSVVVTPKATVTFTGSAARDILTCNFGTLGDAVITGSNIILTVPGGTVVTSLAPTFTVSPFATLSPVSGSSRDFTTAQSYTVTAQNGGTQVYSVKVQTYQSWGWSGSLWLLTTPDGANLPAAATETNFPVLVRLNSSNFTFSQAKPNGEDLRFATATGAPLFYQIEHWDAAAGTASVWVRIPAITGNARQEIRMYWGKADATSESNGAAVFSASNGYVSVFHLADTVQDEVGTLSPVDNGTTVATGLIGKGRHLTAGSGINGGDNITNYPYSSNPFTSECWFRTETFGSTPLYWGRSPTRYNGNTADGDEVSLNVGSPASVGWSSDGSGGVTAATVPAAGQWYQVAATYENGTSRIYVNGQLDGAHTGAMSLYNNIQLKIGGARNSYQFAGDIDEVRVSQVARSANWMKLQYENQKPLQTLVGNPVQAGSSFTVTPGAVTLAEGTSTTLSAQAGGAQKVYWIKKQNGVETVIGVDRFTLDYAAGRVTGNQVFSLQFKAIYPTETKTIDIPFTITEDLPDPVFTLTAPATWDGRQTITVTPNISNLAALQAKGVATCNASWSVTGFAVNKTITPECLTLSYSQGSGPLTVTLTLDNGGSRVTQTRIITVQLPAVEPWVQRSPDADEKPVDNQFFARDDTGQGTIHYRGTLAGSADTVYLKVYATPAGDTESLLDTLRQTPGTGGSYAFSARVAPGLIQYKVVFGSTTGTTDTPLATVSNLVCGDAYLIDGQSNSEARNSDNPVTSEWVRTFTGSWGNASRTVDLSSWPVGYWGLSLALQLVNDYQIPVCIINVGRSGTRIDEHLTSPHSDSYGTVAAAKLTHGIRGVLWHQGESDQASDPNGVPYYQSYQQKFLDMSMVWKTDYPNLQHYYVFQIYPHACGSAWDGSDDKLREVQRTLSRLYSNLRVMSTLGLPGYDGCHYNAAGYEALAQLICPLVEQDNNGRNASEVLTAPDLQQAWFTTAAHTEIALAFNQNMAWNSGVPGLIDLDGVGGLISSGSVSGKVIKLQLTTAATAQTIDYLIGRGGWAQANILYGSNGIPALTFYGVPIAPSPPATLTATAGDGQVTLNWAASAGATGYQIKRALTAGGPYTVIGSATGTSFTDSTAANGTTYRYVVSATISVGDRVGESPDSTEASATPVGLFTSWIGGYFTTPGDPRRDSGADPDHDGLSNFQEFAFGLDPAKGTSANPCTPLLGTRFSYTRRADSGLSYTVEYSTDLTNWNPATVSESPGAADSNGVQTVTVTVSNPALNGKLFVRVKAL